VSQAWPALAGRPVYFTVEADVRTNLTGFTLAIDVGLGWTYSSHELACKLGDVRSL
jgi:hypothetical protein